MRIRTNGLGPIQKLAKDGKTSEEQQELPLARSELLPDRLLASFQSPHKIVKKQKETKQRRQLVAVGRFFVCAHLSVVNEMEPNKSHGY